MDTMMFPPLPAKMVSVGESDHAGGQVGLNAQFGKGSPSFPRRRASNSSVTSTTSSLEDEGYGSWEDSFKHIEKTYARAASDNGSIHDVDEAAVIPDHDNPMGFEMEMDHHDPVPVHTIANATPAVFCSAVKEVVRTRTSSPTATYLLPELLRIIFATLDVTATPHVRQKTLASCALVNKYWNQVATPTLWSNPDLISEHHISLFVKGILLSSRAMNISSNLNNRYPQTNATYIRTLDLTKVRLHEPTHTKELQTLAKTATRFRTLKLWCEQLSLSTLNSLTSTSPFLGTLVVAGHLSTAYTPSYETYELSQTLATLHTIQIDVGFDGDAGRSHLAHLVSTSTGRSLRHLRMAGADADKHTKTLVQNSPHIHTLLYAWSNLTLTGLTYISTLPALRVLDLRGCQQAVTVKSITHLFQSCPIEKIDISFTGGGNAILDVLTEYGPRLDTIIMAGCAVTPASMHKFLYKRGKNLKSLSVAWCASLDSTLLQTIGKHCKNLEKLDVRGCAVHEKGLRQLVVACIGLRVLKLEGASDSANEVESVGENDNEAGIGGEFLDEMRRRFAGEEVVRIEESMM